MREKQLCGCIHGHVQTHKSTMVFFALCPGDVLIAEGLTEKACVCCSIDLVQCEFLVIHMNVGFRSEICTYIGFYC